jgi:integrase
MRSNDEGSISDKPGFEAAMPQEARGETPAVIVANVLANSLESGFAKESEGSPLTFSEYIQTHFRQEHIACKSNPGRRHYYAILKHVMRPSEVDHMLGSAGRSSRSKLTENPAWPYLGHIDLERISPEDVRNLIEAATQRGYSTQTVRHIRNVVRSVFAHAIRHGFYPGENPAAVVSIPEKGRGELHVLTLAQTIEVLERMRYPEREVALMAILTSMTISEICGLQWKSVNLTDHPLLREGISIPAQHIAIRAQRYRGELAPVPRSRRKFIPIPPLLHRVLRNLSNKASAGCQDFVLTTRSGRPINQINLAVRRLKRIGRQVSMPWISWQVFRRTRLSILHEFETRVQDHLSRVIFPTTLPIRPPQTGSKDIH